MKVIDPAKFIDEFAVVAEARGFVVQPLMVTDAGPLIGCVRDGVGETHYLSAGIHGDEPAGPLAARALLDEGFFEDGRRWVVCPALNPTGLAQGTRENATGCDLNRDYLRLGCAETQVHVKWLETQPAPIQFFSLHEDWESHGFYFYEINLGTDMPQRARQILQAVEPWFEPEPSSQIDDHEVRAPGWIYHSAEADFPDHWPEAIYMAKRGCARSFTYETPSSMALEDRVAAHVAAVQAGMPGAGGG